MVDPSVIDENIDPAESTDGRLDSFPTSIDRTDIARCGSGILFHAKIFQRNRYRFLGATIHSNPRTGSVLASVYSNGSLHGKAGSGNNVGVAIFSGKANVVLGIRFVELREPRKGRQIVAHGVSRGIACAGKAKAPSGATEKTSSAPDGAFRECLPPLPRLTPWAILFCPLRGFFKVPRKLARNYCHTHRRSV